MSKIYETRKCVLSILDYVYFHEIAFRMSAKHQKDAIYFNLLLKIDKINLARGYEKEKAELYKHFLLCGVEIKSAIPTGTDNVASDDVKIFRRLLGQIIIQFKKFKFSIDDFLHDLDLLTIKWNIKNIKSSLLHKLVGQCLYYEYDSFVTLEILRVFLKNKILNTKKYRGEINVGDGNLDSNILFRVMLFIEFEIIKKQFYIKSICHKVSVGLNSLESVDKADNFLLFINALIRSKSLIDIEYSGIACSEFKKSSKQYFSDIYERLGHINLFFNDLNDCVETVCGFYTNYFYEVSREHLDDSMLKSREHAMTKTNCIDVAKLLMKKYDFDCAIPLTSATYAKKVSNNYDFASEWLEECYNSEIILMSPDHVIYYFLIKKEDKSSFFFGNIVN